jgi:hypothetical protein
MWLFISKLVKEQKFITLVKEQKCNLKDLNRFIYESFIKINFTSDSELLHKVS